MNAFFCARLKKSLFESRVPHGYPFLSRIRCHEWRRGSLFELQTKNIEKGFCDKKVNKNYVHIIIKKKSIKKSDNI